MEFKITGNCVRILNERPYTKKDGTQDFTCGFVLKVKDGDYDKQLAFTVFGKEKFQRMQVNVGGTYEVSFDLSAREYNGRWYTDLNAWRTNVIAQGQQQSVQPNANYQQQQPMQQQYQQQAYAPQNNPQQVRQDPHPFDQIPPASESNVPF